MTTDTWVTVFDRPDAYDRPGYEPDAGSWGPTPFGRLGSLLPSIAHEWSRLEKAVATTMSSLTPAERQLAALVVSTINASAYHVRLITDELRRLGVPGWILNAVARAPGWPASDDDRLDIITLFAARLTRSPRSMAEEDIVRLRTVDLTDHNIVDLANLVSYYNYVNRIAVSLGLR
ncbi:MAG: carboxymuconolactone decarboxylase family protein [Acidimicrobiia bacterium]